MLLADMVPREIENGVLYYHNSKGGRVGGASRFEGWLDDMPTAGWGYVRQILAPQSSYFIASSSLNASSSI